MSERVELPGIPSLVARSGAELVFTTGEGATFVDATHWPARVFQHPGAYVLGGARHRDGRWLVHARDTATGAWCLRWYERIDATEPTSEEPEPVPARDFAALLDGVEATRLRGELAHAMRVESVHLVGDLPLVVPRHIGLGELHHPFVHRDGRWIEERALPRFDKTLDEYTARCVAATVRLGDGTDVLIWDGHVFVHVDGRFVPFCDQRLRISWARTWEPVAAGARAFHALDDGALVIVDERGARPCLPGVRVDRLHPGPSGSLLVMPYGDPLLVGVEDDRVVEIPASVLGRGDLVAVTADGGLVVHDWRARELRHVAARDLASCPTRRASQAPVEPPPEPVPVLDGALASSRARIAAAGHRIYLCRGRELRQHHDDVARSRLAHGVDLVAVAQTRTAVGVLDVDGVLHVYGHRGSRGHGCSVGTAPRALAVAPASGTWIVLLADGVRLVDLPRQRSKTAPTVRTLDFAAPLAVAAAEDDTFVLVGEGRRLARWTGRELVDRPETAEQIVAIASIGDRRYVCAGEHHLFLLDLGHPELVSLDQPCRGPHLASAPGGRFAWCAAEHAISVGELAGETVRAIERVSYPSTFSEPDDVALRVQGLAFLDDDHLAIALPGGCGNLVDVREHTARKLDPHAGDPRTRWVFILDGQMLVAG